MKKRLTIFVAILMVLALTLAACQKAPVTPVESGKLKVFAAFATPIEEPWDGVIHTALLKARGRGQNRL